MTTNVPVNPILAPSIDSSLSLFRSESVHQELSTVVAMSQIKPAQNHTNYISKVCRDFYTFVINMHHVNSL